MNLIKETKSLSTEELIQESDLHLALGFILKQEEQYWKQRSKATWI